jgi:spermidine/putrescine transport system ATP-binding protein
LKLEVPLKEGWKADEEHKIFVRPEKIMLSSSPMTGPNCFPGRIKHLTYMGASIRYQVDVEGLFELRVDEQNASQNPSFRKGDPVHISLNPGNCFCFRCPSDDSQAKGQK